jgi:uncharacterized protein
VRIQSDLPEGEKNMSAERTDDIPPVATGIFTLPPYDENPPELLGGFCQDCNAHFFPMSKYCPRCLGSLEEARLGSEGTLYSFTVIRKRAPLGLPEPYGIGYIDLAKEPSLRIFGLLDPVAIDGLRIGTTVKLVVGPLGHDGHGSPRLRPFFTPKISDNK